MKQIAFITGGSRGIGKDIALKLAQKDIDIIITYKQEKEKAQSVVDEIIKLNQNAIALQLDIGDVKSFDSFFKQLSISLIESFNSDKIDFIINNGGIGITSSFADTTEEDFDTLFNVLFKGVFFFTQRTLPFLNNNGGIIHISSNLTSKVLPGFVAYSSMKGALDVLSLYQAKELGTRGIRVNVVAPGAIETDFGGGAVRDNQDINNDIALKTVLGRVGLPGDVGGVVAFLCTDDAKWITGQRIEVSGGQFL